MFLPFLWINSFGRANRTKYIYYENHLIGLRGKIRVLNITNNETNNGIHAFLMHAGGAEVSNYIKFIKLLNVQSASLVAHGNLEKDYGDDFFSKIYRKFFKIIKKEHLATFLHKGPSVIHPHAHYQDGEDDKFDFKVGGDSLFWKMHDHYIKVAVDDFFADKKNNKIINKVIFIGHSHGASLKAGDFIKKHTQNNPIKVFLMPCLNPSYESDKYKILFITASKENDGCAKKIYNKTLTNKYKSHEIEGATHYSFLRKATGNSIRGHKFNRVHEKKIVNLINTFIKDSFLKDKNEF